ncbi:MAG: HAD family hydrolase [Myxococcota bacterium]
MGGASEGVQWPRTVPEGGPDEATWRAVGAAIERAGAQALVVFDADGTLWDGDLGEVHLSSLGREGLVAAPAGYDTPFAAYMARCAVDASEGYAYAAELMAGLTESTVVASAQRAWASHRGYLLSQVRAIFDAARAVAEVWIVSASNGYAIRAAAAELGLPPGRVIAMTNRVVGEELQPEILQPRPNGAGKVRCIEAAIGRQPTVAVGNSLHDGAMLDAAELGVLVRAVGQGGETPEWSEALRLRAERGAWLRLDCPIAPRAPAIVG